jgi:hypothetical protein
VLEPERVGDDRGGERAGHGAPQLRTPVPLDRPDEALGLVADQRGEPVAHGLEAERRGERVAVAAVLGPVEREHARADDLAGREARVVDREGLRAAHHLHREIAARDEPAVEHSHPRHRFGLAQAREQRMRVRFELVEGDLGHAPDHRRATFSA